MTSSNGNIFCVTGPLCGEFTGHRLIPLTKASDAELWCFLWSAPKQTVETTTETPVRLDAIELIMTSLWCQVIMMPWRGNFYRITGTLWLVDTTHKGPAIPKLFPCQDIIINLKVILYVSERMNRHTPVTQYSFVCGMCMIINFCISCAIEIIIKQMSNSDNLHMKSYLPFLWHKWKFSAQEFLHVRIRVQSNTYKEHLWRYGECQCSFFTKKLTDAGLHQAWMSMAAELT